MFTFVVNTSLLLAANIAIEFEKSISFAIILFDY